VLRLSPTQFAALQRGERPRRERRGARTEELLASQLRAAGIGFSREHRFVPNRRFRFDFRIAVDLAVEIEGGVHGLKRQFRSDLDKHHLALLHGWRVLRVSPEQVRSGEALRLIRLLQPSACRPSS